MPKIIGKSYKIFSERLLGKGSFSTVYLGMNIRDNKLYAVKTEKKSDKHKLLESEAKIIMFANKHHMSENIKNQIINNYWFGEDTKRTYMVTDLLGTCLDVAHKDCGRQFSLKTSLMLMEQMISIVKYYHGCGIIHRDLKPSNFMFEYNQPSRYLVLIDFGLASKYIINNQHIPYNDPVSRVGTLKFMSPYMHQSIESSRRDDMYSIGYIFIYLLNGSLPWQSVNGETRAEKHSKILEIKQNYASEMADLVNCQCDTGKCLATQFVQDYFKYINTVGFTDEINYNKILQDILVCMKNHNYHYDYQWDWVTSD